MACSGNYYLDFGCHVRCVVGLVCDTNSLFSLLAEVRALDYASLPDF